MKCPKCGGEIAFYDLRPNCKHCGVNIFYYTQETVLALPRQLGHGVALVQIRYNLLLNLHNLLSFPLP